MIILYINEEHCTSVDQLISYFNDNLDLNSPLASVLLEYARPGDMAQWLREHGRSQLGDSIAKIDSSLSDAQYLSVLTTVITGKNTIVEKHSFSKCITINDAFYEIKNQELNVNITCQLIDSFINESYTVRIDCGWGNSEFTINTQDYGKGSIFNKLIKINKRYGVNLGKVRLYIDGKESTQIKSPTFDCISNSIQAIKLKAIQREKSGKYFNIKGIPFKMIRVEGGSFQMGATYEIFEYFDNERPNHTVTLDTYYIGETPVTQELWNAVMDKSHARFSGKNRPIENVSWFDCQSFITKLNQITGLKFRLPTEAQWEYAARGGRKKEYVSFAGSRNINDVAWYMRNSENKTHPVKQKKANILGIYDMCGNVDEWCIDWYEDYTSKNQINPQGPKYGDLRVIRGGSWDCPSNECRVTCRCSEYPSYRDNYIGFRLCLNSD